MAQSNPFPPNIVGYSYFKRKSSPGTISIYGEQHMYKKDIEAVEQDAFLKVVVMQNFKYFWKMLNQNPNSMLFMETSDSLEPNVASNTYSSLKDSFKERVKNIDTRGLDKEDTPEERHRQFEYTKHLQKKYPALLQKLIAQGMSPVDTILESFIIEANALDDIELHKDIDIILYIGDAHRINLSMYMNQHLDGEFTEINNESTPPNDFTSAIFQKQDVREFKEQKQREEQEKIRRQAIFKTQVVEKSGSLRVRGRHPLRRSLLTY
jgi:hypothetical protein